MRRRLRATNELCAPYHCPVSQRAEPEPCTCKKLGRASCCDAEKAYGRDLGFVSTFVLRSQCQSLPVTYRVSVLKHTGRPAFLDCGPRSSAGSRATTGAGATAKSACSGCSPTHHHDEKQILYLSCKARRVCNPCIRMGPATQASHIPNLITDVWTGHRELCQGSR